MEKVAKFEKVSYERFCADLRERFPAADPAAAYAAVTLPKRATTGSAGYDFRTPVDLTLAAGESVRIPTGIRAAMRADWVLQIFPRSGLGFKYRLQLDNTVGIVDSDYYYADNEGHILVQLTNCGTQGKALALRAGDAFAQGVFLPYGVTEDDDARASRRGGFGSTDGSGEGAGRA